MNDDKYKARMQRKKDHIDQRIKSASEERGILILLTGNGKGKSTSGFGNVCRAVGHGMRCVVAQFIKGQWDSGERNLLEPMPNVEFHVMATDFTWNTQDRTYDTLKARETWQAVLPALSSPDVDLVLLDELTYIVKLGYLPEEEVLEALQNRPAMQTVIITGRNAPQGFYDIADTISDIRSERHAFDQGIKARKGIDW
jgi:cob(I)alamin adenosyltransferase